MFRNLGSRKSYFVAKVVVLLRSPGLTSGTQLILIDSTFPCKPTVIQML